MAISDLVDCPWGTKSVGERASCHQVFLLKKKNDARVFDFGSNEFSHDSLEPLVSYNHK